MLVLSRKRDEVICIGNDIKITVTDIRGDNVRIGIEAPKKTVILREELIPRAADLVGVANYSGLRIPRDGKCS